MPGAAPWTWTAMWYHSFDFHEPWSNRYATAQLRFSRVAPLHESTSASPPLPKLFTYPRTTRFIVSSPAVESP
jgi:hypothetical protein